MKSHHKRRQRSWLRLSCVAAFGILSACDAAGPTQTPLDDVTGSMLRPGVASFDELDDYTPPSEAEMAGTESWEDGSNIYSTAGVAFGAIDAQGHTPLDIVGAAVTTGRKAFVIAKGRASVWVDNGIPVPAIKECRGLVSCQWIHQVQADCLNHRTDASSYNTAKAWWLGFSLPSSSDPAYKTLHCEPPRERRVTSPGNGDGGAYEPIEITCTWYQDQVSWDGGLTWENVGAPYQEC